MRYVVDASVVLSWFLPEPHARAAHALVDQSEALLAPDHLLHELAQHLGRRVRQGRLGEDEARDLFEAVHAAPLSLRLSAPFLADALALHLRHGVDLGAARHLSLARHLDLPFVTASGARYRALLAAGVPVPLYWLGDAFGPVPPHGD